MRNHLFALPFALLVLPFAFQERSAQTRPAAATADEADFVFVFLKANRKAPPRPPEQTEKLIAGHLANIGRLADEKKLVVAGPFGTDGDATVRGLFVFDVRTVEEAETLTKTDPAIAAGVMTLEAFPFRTSTSLRRIYDLEKESAATRPKDAGFNIRPYVLVVADDAAKAESGLAKLRADGKVAMVGALGGAMKDKAIFVLDAKDLAGADALLGDKKAEMGALTMRTWFATPNLVRATAAVNASASRPVR